MDIRTFRRHKKISKNHARHCSKCGLPKKESNCNSSNCPVMHCACRLTEPDIND